MKLGVAYNLFDGEELLESSIKSIRDAVDYICVIYQKKSYWGENASKNIGEFLNELKEKDLINEIHLYERDFLKSNDKHKFEREKRDIGLNFCKKSGCTHFMSMDTDEFYDIEQFIHAKDFISKNKIETSAVPIYTYLKSPEYRMIKGYINPHSADYQFFVPFIMKIYKYKRQKHNCEFYPCLVDPTRALNNRGKFYLFSSHDIVMHHMQTIRKDLNKKYRNTSANGASKEYLDKLKRVQESIINFNFEQSQLGNSVYACFGEDKLVKKVENKFNIMEQK